MKTVLGLLILVAGAKFSLAAESAPGHLSSQGWSYTELRRFHAVEARQGVVADEKHLYVISNHAIGKYSKVTGERVAAWECPPGEPLTHLNAGMMYRGLLHCAHSNFPGVPHVSSVEIWDPGTLRPVASVSLGRTDGSLTWFDRREGRWIACFVHYGRQGGEPGKGPEWTRLVEYDDDWRPTGRGWVFPPALIEYLGSRGFGVSGGAFGPDGNLFVTGHDEKELLVLVFPSAGSTLNWVATVPVSAEGQAFAWDPADSGVIHMIIKRERLVVTGRVTRAPPKTDARQ